MHCLAKARKLVVMQATGLVRTSLLLVCTACIFDFVDQVSTEHNLVYVSCECEGILYAR